MPVLTREKIRKAGTSQERPCDVELQSFREEINVAVIKGLRSSVKDISYKAKIQISFKLFDFLQREYGLGFALKENDSILDDFRILRANFKNPRNYCKATHFRVALRRSREIEYKSFSEGQLVTNSLSPLPFFAICFEREDLVLPKRF
jgi:hypothetical protein